MKNEKVLKNILEKCGGEYIGFEIGNKKFEIKWNVSVFSVFFNNHNYDFKNTESIIDFIKLNSNFFNKEIKIDNNSNLEESMSLDILGKKNMNLIEDFLKKSTFVDIELSERNEKKYFNFKLKHKITGESCIFQMDDDNVILEKNKSLLIIDNNNQIKDFVLKELNKMEGGNEKIIDCLGLKELSSDRIKPLVESTIHFHYSLHPEDTILKFYAREEKSGEKSDNCPYSIYVKTKRGISLFIENELNTSFFYSNH